MTGELHHNVRRDTIGKSEADEGLAAGMCTNEFVLGIDLIVTGSVAGVVKLHISPRSFRQRFICWLVM